MATTLLNLEDTIELECCDCGSTSSLYLNESLGVHCRSCCENIILDLDEGETIETINQERNK